MIHIITIPIKSGPQAGTVKTVGATSHTLTISRWEESINVWAHKAVTHDTHLWTITDDRTKLALSTGLQTKAEALGRVIDILQMVGERKYKSAIARALRNRPSNNLQAMKPIVFMPFSCAEDAL